MKKERLGDSVSWLEHPLHSYSLLVAVCSPSLSDFKHWGHNHSLFSLPLLPKDRVIFVRKGNKLTGITWSDSVTYGKQNGILLDLIHPTIY